MPIEEVDHWVDASPELVAHLFEVTHRSARRSTSAFSPQRVGRDHRRLRGAARPHPRDPHQRHGASCRSRTRAASVDPRTSSSGRRRRSAPALARSTPDDGEHSERDADSTSPLIPATRFRCRASGPDRPPLPALRRRRPAARAGKWWSAATDRWCTPSSYGLRDIDAGTPWSDDTLVRLFSMTKPITSVAAMMLYEQGVFDLNDPVAKFIPSFGDARVYRAGSVFKPVTSPADRAGPDLAPADATRRGSRTACITSSHRRAVSQGRVRVGCAARHRSGGRLRPLGGAAVRLPARHRVVLRRVDRRARTRRRGDLGHAARRVLRASTSSAR